jgi:pyroglutamyl-peptidase
MRFQRGLQIIGILILLVPLGMYSASGANVVLVTGFEPFGVYTTNPSQLIAETLNGSSLNDAKIVGVVLPVDFNKSVELAKEAIQHYHPDLVISLGLNARSHVIKVEKIGVNLKRFQKDDGAWSLPHRIDKTGPFLRFTPLHTNDITRKIREANIPVQQSFFAGMYICNALFYGLLGYIDEENVTTTIGFVHVPLLDSQDPEGMPLGTMVDAVKIAIQIGLEQRAS